MSNKIVIYILIMTCFVLAQYERPGSTAAQFLKIDVSPRGTGMAGAYISVVSGAEATYYNPAVIAEMEGTDIVFNHNEWFADINHEFVAIAHNFGDYGAFGLSVTGIYTNEMKVRTPLQPDGTGETFYAGAYKVGLTYARRLTQNVTFGGSVNYLNIKLYDQFTQNAFTLDIAVNFDTGVRGHRFGLSVTNFGQSVTFVNEEYPMPTTFTFGMSVNALEAEGYTLLASGQIRKPNDGLPVGQVGLEFNLSDFVMLRSGYNIGHDVATYAFGLGIKTSLGGSMAIRADYSYGDWSALGAAHRFGIGFSL
jgi:hypothetical protein